MGKSLGSDIHAGKQTALTILAREKNPEQWNDFFRNNDSIGSYQKYFEQDGIKTEAESVTKHYIEKAQEGLSVIEKEKRDELGQFANMILNRKN